MLHSGEHEDINGSSPPRFYGYGIDGCSEQQNKNAWEPCLDTARI